MQSNMAPERCAGEWLFRLEPARECPLQHNFMPLYSQRSRVVINPLRFVFHAYRAFGRYAVFISYYKQEAPIDV